MIRDVFIIFYLLEMGSRPVEGSSKNCILGPPIMASVTHSFLLFPPDKIPAFLFLYSSNCITFIK